MNLPEIVYKETQLSRCISPFSTYLARFLNVILTFDPTIPSTYLLSFNTNEKHSDPPIPYDSPKNETYPHHLPHIGQATGLTLWPLNFLSLSTISIDPSLKFKVYFIVSFIHIYNFELLYMLYLFIILSLSSSIPPWGRNENRLLFFEIFFSR